jgi:type I restriction enzyme M protein
MPSNNTDLEKRLWSAADELRANSRLRAADYSTPVLGLIFLKYADFKFEYATEELKAQQAESARRRRGGRTRALTPDHYKARGVLYVPEEARFQRLVDLPESENIGREINDAMKAIEAHNEALRDVLPKTYIRFQNSTLRTLLRTFNGIPMDIEGDVFGRIYEYFLGQFAMAEGQRGGEFFTPITLVKLIVEVIEPYAGFILDPASGSGGMFVQSADFVQRHRGNTGEISVYGQERVRDTVRLCQMNLAVHGIEGDIRVGNSYYDAIPLPKRGNLEGFDYLMANPPFNVNRVDMERIKNDRDRYPFGMPTVDNANYLWIQLFYSYLNAKGRSGFVMANSAADARGSEQEIRKQLIQTGHVDVMIAIASNFFYTVTLPCTLWFLNKNKAPDHEDKVLFIDARPIYEQIDRAHREFTPAQLEFLSNIVRLYRGHEVEIGRGSERLMAEHFPEGTYIDVPGLCKVATLEEIEAQGWSLNPGRYVGVPDREVDPNFDFKSTLNELNESFETLTFEAHKLEAKIEDDITKILDRVEQV